MANVKLNFAHVCENAFLSQDGKINIIGDFDKIFIKRMKPEAPLYFPFYVVTNFSVDSNKEYLQEIKLVNSENDSQILDQKIKQITSDEKIGLIMRLDAIFPESGIYNLIIKLDGVVYNELKMQIIEQK